MFVELKVYPCANGTLCKCAYDKSDDTIVVFDRSGLALGYIKMYPDKDAEHEEDE